MLLSPFFTLPLRQSFLSSFYVSFSFSFHLLHPRSPSVLSLLRLRIYAPRSSSSSSNRSWGMMKRIPTTESTFPIHKIAMDTYPIQFIDVLGKNIQSLYLWDIHPIAMIGLCSSKYFEPDSSEIQRMYYEIYRFIRIFIEMRDFESRMCTIFIQKWSFVIWKRVRFPCWFVNR